MDPRPPLGKNAHHRPLPPQRAISGVQYHKPASRPGLPSNLSAVRSISQPANLVKLNPPDLGLVGLAAAPLLQTREQVVHSPDVIEVEDGDIEPPPAKRVRTAGGGFRAEGDISHHRAEYDRANERYAGSPLPPVPKSKPAKPRGTQKRTTSDKADPKRAANGVDPPQMATRIPSPRGVADFAPWTGHHPEDIMNEAVVKAGYFDKGIGTNQSESNSARPSIWPNLSQKNHMGLQTLSYLFTQVLDKRQAMGKSTTSSTFKPPPRVTVTDTKREAWLRDLANTEVPLRKQSRTIPHGVRGKGLMEQCLGKNIPLQRAVWLAKCVGANELRAFRRKGVSGAAAACGESKWVREWTVQVEQFLDGVIATCGQPNWQERMNYAVKLATGFFVERLMDANHYLDWIVSSLGDTTAERLPIWIILCQLYWKDIAKYVNRGRKLAEHLLERLRGFMETGHDIIDMMRLRLVKLIAMLAATNRGCLIIPGSWEEYKHILSARPRESSGDIPLTCAENVGQRNERLTAPLRKTPANTRCNLLCLYKILDSVGLDLNIDELTSRLLFTMSNSSTLVSALIDWASSPYRQGESRIYLTATVIATLFKQGHDTDTAILDHLGNTSRTGLVQIDNVHRIVIELVREERFSAGRYLQWLITSGVLAAGEDMRCATELLAVLPTDALPQHMLNTRATLLRRLRIAIPMPAVLDFKSVLEIEEERIPSCMVVTKDMSLVSKINLATTLRQFHRGHGKQYIGIRPFCVLRHALEETGDLSTVIDLLTLVMASDEPSLLSTVVDTINFHAETFAAMGQLHELVDRVWERYRMLRTRQALDRMLILSILSLAKRLPNRGPLERLLASDLTICEQQVLLTACSPASDNLIGMRAFNLDSDEDLDAVFASGNNMDQQLMQRVFLRIIQKAGKARNPESVVTTKLSGWFNQLRSLDVPGFDHLSKSYVQNMFKGGNDGTHSADAVIALVASGCATLTAVLDVAQSAKSASAAMEAMKLLLPRDYASLKLSATAEYRYKVAQQIYLETHAGDVAAFLYRACDDPNFAVNTEPVMELVATICITEPSATLQASDHAHENAAFQPNADRLCMAVLEQTLPGFTKETMDPRPVVSQADPLSIGFCACALSLYAKTQTVHAAEPSKVIEGLLVKAIDDGISVWPQLVEAVGPETRKALHEWAQEQLFVFATGPGFDGDAAVEEVVTRYFDVMDITNEAVQNEDDTHVIITLAEKLRMVEKQLNSITSSENKPEDLQEALRSLHLFLHICVLHTKGHAEKDSDSSHQARSALLVALCSLLVHPRLQIQQSVIEYLFDLAATFADTLTEGSLVGPVRITLSALAVSDPRIASLLGGLLPPAPETWLALASQLTPLAPAPGLSQPQRAFNNFHTTRTAATVSSPTQHLQHNKRVSGGGVAVEVKTTPFALRTWEIMPDPTPVMGENDGSLSLGLFGARRV